MTTENTALTGLKTVTMSSREIAELTGKDHRNVTRDIRAMLDELEEDALKFEHIYFDSMNRQQTEYLLTRELTETLLLGYSAPLRLRVVRRLRELEDALTPKLSYPEALRQLADREEENARQREQLALQAPKVEFAEAVIGGEELMSLTEAAKQLEIPLSKLTELMRMGQWIFKREQYDTLKKAVWQPHLDKIRDGYLVFKKRPDINGVYRDQTMVTGAGLAKLFATFK